jgi:rhodanese-related sulfurtransferase
MNIATISPEALMRRYLNNRNCQLIDVRMPAEYHARHVEFARNVPLDQLDPEALIKSRGGSSDEPLYLICQAGQRSQKACERFLRAGFADVVSVEGGTKACEEAGMPMARRRKTIGLERQIRIAAGSLILIGVLLGWLVHPAFFGLAAFIGAGLIFAGITDTCGMGILLARMPWNRYGSNARSSCGA